MTNEITRKQRELMAQNSSILARRTKARLVVGLQRELGDIAKLIVAEEWEDAFYDLDRIAESVEMLDAWLRDRLDEDRDQQQRDIARASRPAECCEHEPTRCNRCSCNMGIVDTTADDFDICLDCVGK